MQIGRGALTDPPLLGVASQGPPGTVGTRGLRPVPSLSSPSQPPAVRPIIAISGRDSRANAAAEIACAFHIPLPDAYDDPPLAPCSEVGTNSGIASGKDRA